MLRLLFFHRRIISPQNLEIMILLPSGYMWIKAKIRKIWKSNLHYNYLIQNKKINQTLQKIIIITNRMLPMIFRIYLKKTRSTPLVTLNKINSKENSFQFSNRTLQTRSSSFTYQNSLIKVQETVHVLRLSLYLKEQCLFRFYYQI